MDWYRMHHGMPIDPKWITVAGKAGAEVTPGHVVAVWAALLDHASQSRPRGSVEGFQADDIAASFRWPEEHIQAIVAALIAKRLIVDGHLVAWSKRQPEKEDTTAAERKQRQRARAKNSQTTPSEGDESHGMSRRDARDAAGQSRVTPLEEKEQSDFSSASADLTNPRLKPNTQRIVREQARAFENVGAIWTALAAAGMPAGIGIRTFNRKHLADWIAAGLTEPQLAEAIARARQRRQEQRSAWPVNLGFLACFVDEVMAGEPSKSTTGGGYERGDQLSAEFAHVR